MLALRLKLSVLFLLLAGKLPALAGEAPDRAVDWKWLIEDETEVRLPLSLEHVEWKTDLEAAFELARRLDRPVFVTLRCLPCKQCADFDRDVLEGGPRLAPYLRQFVTVRLTRADDLDPRIFPFEGYQDLDVSWWGYLFTPQKELLSIFGGKDHISDSSRISVGALIRTLQSVLEHYHHPRREEFGWKGWTSPASAAVRRSPRDLPGHASWKEKFGHHHPPGCLHCHQVADILRQPALDAGTFDKERDLDMWPLPENVGIVVDRDEGLLVKEVRMGSPAEKAGLLAGDRLEAAGGVRLFSQADFRGVLHRGPRKSGEIEVWWSRDGKARSGTLRLKDGWRFTILDWRMSVSQGNIGVGPGFFPIQGPRRGDRLTSKPYFGPKRRGPSYEAGLRPHHLILKVNGERPPGPGRSFLVWFRKRFDDGDRITLEIEDGGQKREITYVVKRPTRPE